MYQARGMVPQFFPSPQQVGMKDPTIHRPQSPDESFLASLRHSIECHFNPENILQNDVLQAILMCYQGCYPLQLVMANQHFQMYIAHCTELNLPVLETFIRALEHSRVISVTEDRLFLYLVAQPPHNMAQATHNTTYLEAASVASEPPTRSLQGFCGISNGMMPGGCDNVQELASINHCAPNYMSHHHHHQQQQYHPGQSSESPTSVFEAAFYVNGNYENYDKHPSMFIQPGATMFVPTTAYAVPRPTRQSNETPSQPPEHGATIPSCTTTSSFIPAATLDDTTKEEGQPPPNHVEPKQVNKRRTKNNWRKKKNHTNKHQNDVAESTKQVAATTEALKENMANLSIVSDKNKK